MAKASSPKGAVMNNKVNIESILLSRVDKDIGKRYTAMGDKDYFNEAGHGRFLTYCVENKLVDKVGAVRKDLLDSSEYDGCTIIDFADDGDSFASFPGLAGDDLSEKDRKYTVFKFVKDCVHAQQLLSLFSEDAFELHVDEWFTLSDGHKLSIKEASPAQICFAIRQLLDAEEHRKLKPHSESIIGFCADIDGAKLIELGREGFCTGLAEQCKIKNGPAASKLFCALSYFDVSDITNYINASDAKEEKASQEASPAQICLLLRQQLDRKKHRKAKPHLNAILGFCAEIDGAKLTELKCKGFCTELAKRCGIKSGIARSIFRDLSKDARNCVRAIVSAIAIAKEKAFLRSGKMEYQTQVKILADKIFADDSDEAALKVMMIGRKWHYDYLLNLVDDFLRCEVRREIAFLRRAKSLKENRQDKLPELDIERDVSAWINNKRSKHFKSLRSETRKNSEDAPHLLVQAAVTRFLTVCPRLSLAEQEEKFNDSLETTVHHITNAAAFVQRLAQESRNYPFHFDLFIVYDVSVPDDEDPDDLERYDLETLRYCESYVKEAKKGALFDDTYRKFARKAEFENARPRNKRFLGLIDRQHRIKNHPYELADEKLIMLEPHEKAGRNIPKDAVPEFMMGYSPIVRYEQYNFIVPENGCYRFLAVSFHVTADGCIKAYLFTQGKYMRFASDDIFDILPMYFEDDKQNTFFATNPDLHQSYIDSLDESLTDPIFKAFRTAIED